MIGLKGTLNVSLDQHHDLWLQLTTLSLALAVLPYVFLTYRNGLEPTHIMF